MSTSGRQRLRAERTQAEFGRGSTRASPRASLQLSRRRLQRIATIGRGGRPAWGRRKPRAPAAAWDRAEAPRAGTIAGAGSGLRPPTASLFAVWKYYFPAAVRVEQIRQRFTPQRAATYSASARPRS